jgi:hypothetical protein
VLSLPYELRRPAAFKADVLTALARIVGSVFASYRSRAKRNGPGDAQCGSVLAVRRFGSLLVLDGVFTRDAEGARAPTRRRHRRSTTLTRQSAQATRAKQRAPRVKARELA